LRFPELYKSLNQISTQLYELKKTKESQNHYIEALLKEAQLSLVAFNTKGTIKFSNECFHKTMNTSNYLIGKQIDEILPKFRKNVEHLDNGTQKIIEIENKTTTLSLFCAHSYYKFDEESYHLYVLQDIRNEILKKEIETWQKLMRVLAHEIMNSTIPIHSLSNSMFMDLTSGKEVSREKLSTGIQAIKERSAGLMKFSNAYQKLSKIPQPEKESVHIPSLLNRLEALFQSEMQKHEIQLKTQITKEVSSLYIDKYLVEQALVNILKNAIECFEETGYKEITIKAYKFDSNIFIEIRDNGPGIKQDLLEKLFTPFFSTKEDGDGIGLSFSKQIMYLHEGDIQVASEVDSGTIFQLIFRL